jgi:hypothetical protein
MTGSSRAGRRRNAAEVQARAAEAQAREEKRQAEVETKAAEVRARLQAGPTAITMVSWTGRTYAMLLVAVYVYQVFGRSPRARGPADIGYLAFVALVSILLLYGGWQMRVRFDDRGVTVHQFLRTRRFSWPEVSHFADGRINVGHGWEPNWVLKIVLRDGRAVRAGATMGWAHWARPKVLATVRAVAELHAVPAQLTGKPPGDSAARTNVSPPATKPPSNT